VSKCTVHVLKSERIVVNRTEYYGSRNKEFWFSLRLDIPRTVEEMKKVSINDRIFDDYTSYRELHDALWDVDTMISFLTERFATTR
jgi:hypothetical protein